MNPKDQIKQSLSILDVVSTYVRLEKSGSQYKGRCPFHNEKTPSFYVSQDRGTYHCFGCNEHGDIFSFIEKIESVPFYEALTILADRSGIKLSPYKKEEKDKESNLISLLQKATYHFEKNLENSPLAKSYLGSRALLPETIKKFNIGFALGGESGWRDLFIDLSKNGFSPEEMISAGVVIKKEGDPTSITTSGQGDRYFDRFRGRIMFPTKNSLGNVVGYSARILPELDDGKAGKYINSPETDVYHKSKILFGYDLAKKSINEKKEVILVEGQMDLIMSHQAGIQNIVAVSGTSLTEDHIKILKRFADKVLLSFDQDEAGEKAMKRSALLALYGGLDVFIIPKKGGVKDTADLIKEFGGEAWRDLINKRVHLIEYLLSSLFAKVEDERERLKIARVEILPYLRAIESDMDKAYFIRFLASKLNIEEIDIYNDLKKIKNINGEEFSTTKEEVKKQENILSKKDLILKEILAILKFKNLDQEKFLAKYFESINIIDYKKLFLDEKENFPEEIIEKEISKVEDKFSNNANYIEDDVKFINEILKELINNYKLELLEEEAKNVRVLSEKDTEENLIRVSDLRKEIHKLKTEK